MPLPWDERLAQWQAELELAAELEGVRWVTLARAEAEVGVSRSTLRSWYRTGQLRSRLVDGPHGPQRLVPLDDVIQRAERSPRIRHRAEREVSLEAQLELVRHRLAQVEQRLAALERAPDGLTTRRGDGGSPAPGAARDPRA